MRFCPVCGRDHAPGPCPISSLAPQSPGWEAKQYLRICKLLVMMGLVPIVAAQFTSGPGFGMGEIVGTVLLVLGLVTYMISRRKQLELDSPTEA
jgi:hypothetical protein